MKKILIIEDDAVVSHIYRNRLEKAGFQVEVAGDGQAGYYRIYETKPDALLLDLMLPKMNGIELLKKIRAVREHSKLPVLVFTNAYVANMIDQAFTAGATAVYNKSSVTPRHIVDVLNTIMLSGASARPEAQPSEPAAAPAPVLRAADDGAFQAGLLQNFRASMNSWVLEMRKSLQDVSKAADDGARATNVEQLYRKVRTFSSNAAMGGLTYAAKLAAALEALVKEMLDKPGNVTLSTLRTAAHAIDCLGDIAALNLPVDLADNPPVEILVVDDDVLSRRAIVYALEKAFLKAAAVENAEEALDRSGSTKFDLMFLDVHMPGMDGFQLCQKLRDGALNRATPVVFVTSTADFQAKAQSTLHGASDLIAKPFMFIELTVKALTFALRHRAEGARRALPNNPSPLSPSAEPAAAASSPETAEIIV